MGNEKLGIAEDHLTVTEAFNDAYIEYRESVVGGSTHIGARRGEFLEIPCSFWSTGDLIVGDKIQTRSSTI